MLELFGLGLGDVGADQGKDQGAGVQANAGQWRIRLAPLAAMMAGGLFVCFVRWTFPQEHKDQRLRRAADAVLERPRTLMPANSETGQNARALEEVAEVLRRHPLEASDSDRALLWEWLGSRDACALAALVDGALDWLWRAAQTDSAEAERFLFKIAEIAQDHSLPEDFREMLVRQLAALEEAVHVEPIAVEALYRLAGEQNAPRIRLAALAAVCRLEGQNGRWAREMLKQFALAPYTPSQAQLEALHLLYDRDVEGLVSLCRGLASGKFGELARIASLHLLGRIGDEQTLSWISGLSLPEGTAASRAAEKAGRKLLERLGPARPQEETERLHLQGR